MNKINKILTALAAVLFAGQMSYSAENNDPNDSSRPARQSLRAQNDRLRLKLQEAQMLIRQKELQLLKMQKQLGEKDEENAKKELEHIEEKH